MHDDEIVLTPSRYKELEADLLRLSTLERSEIAERIRQARAMGDLSENFDYQDAKRQQGLLEGKIINLKNMLDRAHVTEYAGGGEIVTLGSVVKVHDQEFDEDVTYTIVGVMDADASQNKISNTSPVGKALIGHKVGDRVDAITPAGTVVFQLVDVS